MEIIVAALTVALFTAAPPADLPEDQFQRVAIRALAGEFGKLQDWQELAYKRGLAQGVRADRRAWLTYYTRYNRRGELLSDGINDRYGNPLTLRVAAARDEQLPRRCYVWTEYGMRQVLDTGAWSNMTVARSKGGPGTVWVDYYYVWPHHAPFGTAVTPLAVIRP